MARLSRAESAALLKLFSREQNLLKGTFIDLARLAVPQTREDRQFRQIRKSTLDAEAALRGHFMNSLVEAGIIEPLTMEEVQSFK